MTITFFCIISAFFKSNLYQTWYLS